MNAAQLEIGNNLLILLMALIPTIPAVIAAVVSIRQNKELKPNHGTSMHDKVDKVYRAVAATDRADDTTASVTVDKKS